MSGCLWEDGGKYPTAPKNDIITSHSGISLHTTPNKTKRLIAYSSFTYVPIPFLFTMFSLLVSLMFSLEPTLKLFCTCLFHGPITCALLAPKCSRVSNNISIF